MKKGNWTSRRSYKKNLSGCHRPKAPRGVDNRIGLYDELKTRSLGSMAGAIIGAMMKSLSWRGKR